MANNHWQSRLRVIIMIIAAVIIAIPLLALILIAAAVVAGLALAAWIAAEISRLLGGFGRVLPRRDGRENVRVIRREDG